MLCACARVAAAALAKGELGKQVHEENCARRLYTYIHKLAQQHYTRTRMEKLGMGKRTNEKSIGESGRVEERSIFIVGSFWQNQQDAVS